jgi:NADPH:quinone reductase-like Zn-dependent oxidoreductase
MRAAVLTGHGPAENIMLRDWPDPEPGPGEVVVEVRAASLNRRDWWIMRNPARGFAPGVLGSDAAGVRADTGEEVIVYPALGWGDAEDAPGPSFQIFGVPRQGVFAERVVVEAGMVYPKPAHLSFEEAACLGIAGLTAWRALLTRGGLRPGQTVLVTGAAAGTGTFAIQIAVALGARVLVTTSSAEKLERCMAVGAAGGADWREPDWPARIRELAGGGVDLVIDSAGAASWPGALEALRDGGTLVGFGDTAGDRADLDVMELVFRQLSLHGTTMGSPREFAAFLDHVAADSWRPVIDSVLPLAETAAAFRRLEDPDRFGKVVLAVA